MIRHLVGLLITDVINATDVRLRESNVKSGVDIQKLNHNLIGHSEDMQRRNRELKDFLYTRLYRHYRVVRMQVKAERIITNLFTAYRQEPPTLPNQVQQFIAIRGLERTICDYIAGMTDRFAVEEHERLFDPFLRP